jgi:hypothetical protein
MRLIFIADNAYDALKIELRSIGTVIEVPEIGNLYPGVKNHPDLHIHIIDNRLFISKDIAPIIHSILDANNVPYEIISEVLGDHYPATAHLNALSFPEYFIHPKSITATALATYVASTPKNWVDLKQGYMRCSALPVGSHGLITSDIGIQQACKPYTIEVLSISSGHIQLDGQPYGFIGGTAGQIGNTVYFNGSLDAHPDCNRIRGFIVKNDLTIVDIPILSLKDIGSIMTYEGGPS